MIDVETALARILALGRLVSVEKLPLVEAAGRWLAEDIVARRTQPARDLSAMDGYAIRFDDMPGPWTVIGESAAGAPFGGAIVAGQASRIFTGAALPEGADSILIQEDVAREGERITLTGEGPTRRASSVRSAGSDFAEGALLLQAGHPLGAAAIALAAMGGFGDLVVRRNIRVAILSTGDELVPPGEDPGADRLPCSNGVMLQALLANLPADVTDFGIVPDDRDALVAAFARALDFDVIVTTGGASVGDHDLVRPCLLDAGAMLDFWKVAMRPGKPLMAGTLGDAVVLGLPGNPVSAFVTATLFLLPLVRHLSGATRSRPVRIAAELGAPMGATGPRADFVRAQWSDGAIVPLPSADSGALGPLAMSTALIARPPNAHAIEAGARVEVILLG